MSFLSLSTPISAKSWLRLQSSIGKYACCSPGPSSTMVFALLWYTDRPLSIQMFLFLCKTVISNKPTLDSSWLPTGFPEKNREHNASKRGEVFSETRILFDYDSFDKILKSLPAGSALAKTWITLPWFKPNLKLMVCKHFFHFYDKKPTGATCNFIIHRTVIRPFNKERE